MEEYYRLIPLEINVDCSDILLLIKNEKSKYANINFYGRNLLHQLGNLLIKYTYREVNSVANAFAKEGAKMYNLCSFIILEIPPSFVQSNVEANRNEIAFARIQRRPANYVPNMTNIYSDFVNIPSVETISRTSALLLITCNEAY